MPLADIASSQPAHTAVSMRLGGYGMIHNHSAPPPPVSCPSEVARLRAGDAIVVRVSPNGKHKKAYVQEVTKEGSLTLRWAASGKTTKYTSFHGEWKYAPVTPKRDKKHAQQLAQLKAMALSKEAANVFRDYDSEAIRAQKRERRKPNLYHPPDKDQATPEAPPTPEELHIFKKKKTLRADSVGSGVRPAVVVAVGSVVEAKDYLGEWHKAKITGQVKKSVNGALRSYAKVHFHGWNKRFDECVPVSPSFASDPGNAYIRALLPSEAIIPSAPPTIDTASDAGTEPPSISVAAAAGKLLSLHASPSLRGFGHNGNWDLNGSDSSDLEPDDVEDEVEQQQEEEQQQPEGAEVAEVATAKKEMPMTMATETTGSKEGEPDSEEEEVEVDVEDDEDMPVVVAAATDRLAAAATAVMATTVNKGGSGLASGTVYNPSTATFTTKSPVAAAKLHNANAAHKELTSAIAGSKRQMEKYVDAHERAESALVVQHAEETRRLSAVHEQEMSEQAKKQKTARDEMKAYHEQMRGRLSESLGRSEDALKELDQTRKLLEMDVFILGIDAEKMKNAWIRHVHGCNGCSFCRVLYRSKEAAKSKAGSSSQAMAID